MKLYYYLTIFMLLIVFSSEARKRREKLASKKLKIMEYPTACSAENKCDEHFDCLNQKCFLPCMNAEECIKLNEKLGITDEKDKYHCRLLKDTPDTPYCIREKEVPDQLDDTFLAECSEDEEGKEQEKEGGFRCLGGKWTKKCKDDADCFVASHKLETEEFPKNIVCSEFDLSEELKEIVKNANKEGKFIKFNPLDKYCQENPINKKKIVRGENVGDYCDLSYGKPCHNGLICKDYMCVKKCDEDNTCNSLNNPDIKCKIYHPKSRTPYCFDESFILRNPNQKYMTECGDSVTSDEDGFVCLDKVWTKSCRTNKDCELYRASPNPKDLVCKKLGGKDDFIWHGFRNTPWFQYLKIKIFKKGRDDGFCVSNSLYLERNKQKSLALVVSERFKEYKGIMENLNGLLFGSIEEKTKKTRHLAFLKGYILGIINFHNYNDVINIMNKFQLDQNSDEIFPFEDFDSNGDYAIKIKQTIEWGKLIYKDPKFHKTFKDIFDDNDFKFMMQFELKALDYYEKSEELQKLYSKAVEDTKQLMSDEMVYQQSILNNLQDEIKIKEAEFKGKVLNRAKTKDDFVRMKEDLTKIIEREDIKEETSALKVLEAKYHFLDWYQQSTKYLKEKHQKDYMKNSEEILKYFYDAEGELDGKFKILFHYLLSIGKDYYDNIYSILKLEKPVSYFDKNTFEDLINKFFTQEVEQEGKIIKSFNIYAIFLRLIYETNQPLFNEIEYAKLAGKLAGSILSLQEKVTENTQFKSE